MTAIVTAGASGMGESMVYALAKEGASIIVVDRNMDGANAVVTNAEEQGGKAIDLAPKNIRVNGISPGMIASPFNRRFSEGERLGPLGQMTTWSAAGVILKTSMARLFFSHLTSLALLPVQTLKLKGAGLQPGHV